MFRVRYVKRGRDPIKWAAEIEALLNDLLHHGFRVFKSEHDPKGVLFMAMKDPSLGEEDEEGHPASCGDIPPDQEEQVLRSVMVVNQFIAELGILSGLRPAEAGRLSEKVPEVIPTFCRRHRHAELIEVLSAAKMFREHYKQTPHEPFDYIKILDKALPLLEGQVRLSLS